MRLNISNKFLQRYKIPLPKVAEVPNVNPNNRRFHGKVVVITGASSGIGRACALQFAQMGATVVLSSRRLEMLQEVQKEIEKMNRIAVWNHPSLCVKADIREIEDCKKLIDKTIEAFGRIDVLINNAGISMRANFEELDLKVIKELMDTNFYGTVYCTKFALPHLLKHKGTVVGISSISGLVPLPGRTGYAASKHAMDGFLNTLRLENKRKGLNVMIVHPGFTNSNIRLTALNKDGNPQAESPRDEGKMMSSSRVAEIIAKAVFKRERDLILTPQGRMVVWLRKNFPGVADRILLHEMEKEPDSPLNKE